MNNVLNEIINNIYYYLNSEYFSEWLKDLCNTYSLVEKMPEEYKDHIFEGSVLPKAKHLLGGSLEAALNGFDDSFDVMENFNYVDKLCSKNTYAMINWGSLPITKMKELFYEMKNGMSDDEILQFINLWGVAKGPDPEG